MDARSDISKASRIFDGRTLCPELEEALESSLAFIRNLELGLHVEIWIGLGMNEYEGVSVSFD